jgi:hypothetical protein
MISCDFVDFEETVDMVFELGRTPIIVDTSPDEKVCTYFSYQPDVLIFDTQAMVAAWSLRYQQAQIVDISTGAASAPTHDTRRVLLELLEPLRRSLVQAMKFGKMLAIRLGNSVPDFMHKFSDEALDIDNTQRGSGYFPLLAFERGGYFLREPLPVTNQSSRKNTNISGGHRDLTWAERLFREEDMKPHKNVAFCRYVLWSS